MDTAKGEVLFEYLHPKESFVEFMRRIPTGPPVISEIFDLLIEHCSLKKKHVYLTKAASQQASPIFVPLPLLSKTHMVEIVETLLECKGNETVNPYFEE